MLLPGAPFSATSCKHYSNRSKATTTRTTNHHRGRSSSRSSSRSRKRKLNEIYHGENAKLTGTMGPTTFREQLRTIFNLRLTRAEVAGLVSVFDLHRDGMIDAKEFAFRCAG